MSHSGRCWFCRKDKDTKKNSIEFILRKKVGSDYTGLPTIGVEKIYYQEKSIVVPCCLECKKAYLEKSAYEFIGGILTIGMGIGAGILFRKIFEDLSIYIIIAFGIITACSFLYIFMKFYQRRLPSLQYLYANDIDNFPSLKSSLKSGWWVHRQKK